MTPEEGQAAIEAVKDKYAPRIMEYLTRAADELREQGFKDVNGPYDRSDDRFIWTLSALRPEFTECDEDGIVDLDFEISESMQYDEEMVDGMSFGITCVEWSGRELGRIQPWNFTPQVWVSASDPEAVEQRFLETTSFPAEDWVSYIPKLVLTPTE